MLTAKTEEEVVAGASGLDTGQYKREVAEIVVEKLRPIRERAVALLADEAHLASVLRSGTDRARQIAETNLNEVKQKVGLLQPFTKS